MTEGGAGGGFLPPEPRGRAFGGGSSSAPPPTSTPESSVPEYESMDWGAAPLRAGDEGNSGANVSFALALGSAGLLLFTGGASSIVSLALSVAAVVLGQQARARVERGETSQYANVAMGGLVLGIITALLAFAATVFVVAALVRQ